ncbi:MAG: lysine transporter LysE [Methanobacteriota archaeon]|nr:MAG: lysine transporter LysE [Euryarchaeota archaeon]
MAFEMITNFDIFFPISNPYIFFPVAYLISFSGVLIPGPMTAVSIAKGYEEKSAGLKIAAGHGIIEVPLILLIYFGFARFFKTPGSPLLSLISFFGGLMLIYMGTVMFRLRKTIVEKGRDMPVSSLGAGIITTGGNPSFFIWWATLGALLVFNAAIFGPIGLLLFIIVHESADLLWYGLLAFGTHKSKHLMTPRFHELLFAFLAMLLAAFGAWFMASALA